MNNKTSRFAVIIVLLLGVWFMKVRQGNDDTFAPPGLPVAPVPYQPAENTGKTEIYHSRGMGSVDTGLFSAGPYLIGGVEVIDTNNGKKHVLGTVDLRRDIERIAAGEKHSHRNDGTVFRNFEKILPQKPSGYYREYVVPTKGIHGAGPQRLVIGKEGEIYYTPDHYETFIRVAGQDPP